MSIPSADISLLEAILGHTFDNSDVLCVALTHRSFANEEKERDIEDNERLEFLGDAVLDLILAHDLMERFPELSEGDLSKTRSQMASEVGLSKVANELELGRWLRLGAGEDRSHGRLKPSILADALEAVIAAVYLDGGIEAARRVVLTIFSQYGPIQPGLHQDHKTRLQELVQAQLKIAPIYQVLGEEGPSHDRIFEVGVFVGGVEKARATGRTKKAAEQSAALLAINRI